jgi:MFS family permease
MLLTAIATFNYVDRVVLGIVLQDIKVDLGLTDTQLGLLTGIAFALFYSVMGLPIARWADRGNRVTIISVTTGLWTLALMACAAVTSFFQLLLVRVGVAVGEAGCIPPAHSLIADYFSRAERPRAVAIYMLGFPLALTFGNFAAGWLNELYGWRATFVILGLPGLALVALAAGTLTEPRRSLRADRAAAPTPAPEKVISVHEQAARVWEVFSTLWANTAFRHLLVCFSTWYFFGYGILQWTPAFFIRSHGLQTGELGTWFALIYGLGGGVGTYLGGVLAQRFAAGNERIQLRVCAVSFSFFAVLTAGAFLASDHRMAFAALALGALGGNLSLGPILATMQTLVAPRMRAMSIAIVYLFANLIGMGLGPLAAGALSDALQPAFADESLRYALVILCPGYFWAAFHLWRASSTVHRDLRGISGLAPEVDSLGEQAFPKR